MTAAIRRRLAALEASQPAPVSLLTPHALDRLTDVELEEIQALFLEHVGDRPADLADLPDEVRGRALALLTLAGQRQDPEPWPSAPPRN